MLAAEDPYPTNTVAPATFGVDTLLRMVTAWFCEVSTLVRYACIVEADTATRCPVESTWARTQTIESASGSTPTGGDVTRFDEEPCTRFDGACANTKMLALVPTSCARGWNWALTLLTVGVTLPDTVIGKTGDAETLAWKATEAKNAEANWELAQGKGEIK